MTDQAAPSTARHPLLRSATVLLAAVVGGAFIVHRFGGSTAVVIIAVLALGALFAVILRFLPHLRKHFNANRGRRATRRSRTSRSVRSSSPGRSRLAGGRTGRARHIPRSSGRRSRAGSGMSRRRGAGAAGGLNRRRARPPSSTPRRRVRGSGAGSAARRAGSQSRRNRRPGRPGGGPAARRRRAAAGASLARRRAGTSSRRRTAGRGPGRTGRTNPNSRRRITRPSTWRRSPGRARSSRAQQRRARLLPWRRPGRSAGGARRPSGSSRRRGLLATRPARRAQAVMQRARRRRATGSRAGLRRRGPVGMLTRRRSGVTRRGPVGTVARRAQQRRVARAGRERAPWRRSVRRPLTWFAAGRARIKARHRARFFKAPKLAVRRSSRIRRFRRRKPSPGPAITVPAPSGNGHRPAAPVPPARFQPPPPPTQPTTAPRGRVMHNAVEPIAETAREQFGRYEPQGPLEWLEYMQSLPELFQEFGDGFGQLGDKLASDFPSPDGVPDMWADLAASMRGLVDHAAEMAAKFEADPRVQRALNPQPGEPVLDVQND